jgi:YVTN family beta-propeller protein
MGKCRWLLLALLFAPLALPCRPSPAQPQKPDAPAAFKSPLGLAVDPAGRHAYVALYDAGAVAVVDLQAGKVLAEIPVGKQPHDLGLHEKTLFVTCEGDDTLVVVDLAKNAVRQRVAVGAAPRGLAVDAAGKRVFVACHDDGTVRQFDPEGGQVRDLFAQPWPDRLAVSADGQRLYVTANDAGKALLTTVALAPKLAVDGPRPVAGASNLRGVVALPGSNGAFVAHQRPRNHLPATQVAQGWVFTNALTKSTELGLVSAELALKAPPRVLLDETNRGAADPSDIAITPDGRRVFVACAGADIVVVLDSQKLVRFEARRPEGYDYPFSPAGEGVDDLGASRHYVSVRLGTQANPRRLALSGDGRTLVVSNHLGDSLTVIDADRLQVVRHIPLATGKPDSARRGAALFHSARLTFQGQFSCASCHPNGGGDGLNWDLTRDGVGNFMNTRSLLGVKDTAPYGWHASSPTLADRVTGTLRTLHQHEPTVAETADLVAFLKTLAPPRPLPVPDAAAVARGRALFLDKAQCAKCHRSDAYDDDRPHDLGTRGPGDVQAKFDTPSLRGVARTAPYLHDGRAATLADVFGKHNAQQRHGAAHQLNKAELADLLAFLRSL